MSKRKARKEVTRYRFKRKPYKHQVAALKKLLKRKGGALLMEPRTGKTQVAIDYASVLHAGGKVNRVLILPPLGVMGVWEDEIAAVCPHPHRVLVWDKDARKQQELPKYGRDILDFVILNHEALAQAGEMRQITRGPRKGQWVRSTKSGGRYTMVNKLLAWGPQLIIVDESHRFKNPNAQKSKSLYKIGPIADYRVIATGTAITKKRKVLDIYGQWQFLDPRGWIRHYTPATFKAEFTVEKTGSWGGKQWLRNNEQAMPRLRLRIHKDSYAVTRAEAYDLPPSRVQKITIPLTGHTAEVYDEMVEEMVAQIKTGEMTEAQIKLVLRLRLAQITSGFVKTVESPDKPSRLVRIGKDKLNVLESLLSDLYEADEKVVVAARFRADIATIVNLHKPRRPLSGVKVWELHGGVDRRTRDANIRAFRQHDEGGLFIMQPGAGALGIDLSTSASMIWYSYIDSYVDWTQAHDRIALSPRGTVYTYLIAENTIDQIMLDSMAEDDAFVKMMQRPERLRRHR